jgi:hypothetical protein
MRSKGDELDAETRGYIEGLVETLERERAEKVLLEDELRTIKEVKKKERKAHTPKQLGTHQYSQPRVLATIQANEAEVKRKKADKRRRDEARTEQAVLEKRSR